MRSNSADVALVTGSGGLIGSACVELFAKQGFTVVGIDNDMRAQFFGPQASTRAAVEYLQRNVSAYRHLALDIRDRSSVRDVMEKLRPNLIVHAAAQPSHDRAAAIPYEDFDVNAVGTLNLLVAARDFCPESPFCFTSTNKVYGDRPNQLPLLELEMRYDYADGLEGVDEELPIDQCLHSLFGASKVSADVLCQEFGRYFGMPVGIFRGGCLTGPNHAAVELHGFLNYIISCAVNNRPFTIFGYKGKQVRDQIHADDVARLFLEFKRSPRAGEVYNLGGGRENSISVLEAIELLSDMNLPLDYSYLDQHRKGDHICYITDLGKIKRDFPEWRIHRDLSAIFDEIADEQLRRKGDSARCSGAALNVREAVEVTAAPEAASALQP